MFSYIPRITQAARRKTREVRVGDVTVGGKNPIVIQSMTTTPTTDTHGTVQQIQKLVEVGCQIVRLTVPTQADMDNIPNIREAMKKQNIKVPLVADIHFLPKLALLSLDWFEKVRINPGNFADRKKFEVVEYTDEAYQEELDRIREVFLPIVRRAKLNGVSLRIGTNHGSLSDRIMNRFGDTPLGMVESALEFIRIAEDENYQDIVISMKASNVQVMIQAYRLLVARMNELGMDYPLHLGVTEAGDGEDGRIKSAMGIGSLLADGLGDTIRVSLTEDPEHEIPVAKRLARLYEKPGTLSHANTLLIQPSWDFYKYQRRESQVITSGEFSVGGRELVKVVTNAQAADLKFFEKNMDPGVEKISVQVDKNLSNILSKIPQSLPVMLKLNGSTVADLQTGNVPYNEISTSPSPIWLEEHYILKIAEVLKNKTVWFKMTKEDQVDLVIEILQLLRQRVTTGVEVDSDSLVDLGRIVASKITRAGLKNPIHLCFRSRPNETESDLIIRAPVEMGSLLCDGIGDSVEVVSQHATEFNHLLAFNILQASRLRMSKTEYIACPSCGRTLFDLQETTAKIRQKTWHLKGLKIAVMGCIVNGPGEMADADFGYVGSGPGHINLYVGKECVQRHIPQDRAVDELIELIKSHDRWIDPPH